MADALQAAVEDAYRQNDFNVLLFSYEVDHYQPVDLQALYNELCTDMADAYYDEQAHALVRRSTASALIWMRPSSSRMQQPRALPLR